MGCDLAIHSFVPLVSHSMGPGLVSLPCSWALVGLQVLAHFPCLTVKNCRVVCLLLNNKMIKKYKGHLDEVHRRFKYCGTLCTMSTGKYLPVFQMNIVPSSYTWPDLS